MSDLLLRTTVKERLSEDDPLYALVSAQSELLKSFLDEAKRESLAQHATQAKEIREACRNIPEAKEERSKGWLKLGITLTSAAAVFLSGWLYANHQANARIDALVAAMPTASRVPLFLAEHGASIRMGTIKGPRDRQGLIIEHGKLKFGQPTFSTAGEALVPFE